jgi:hypothetical protein
VQRTLSLHPRLPPLWGAKGILWRAMTSNPASKKITHCHRSTLCRRGPVGSRHSLSDVSWGKSP